MDTLISAAASGELEDVEFLLASGHDPNRGFKLSDEAPLYVAAHHGHSEIVKVLIKHGAHIDRTPNDGPSLNETALHGTCRGAHHDSLHGGTSRIGNEAFIECARLLIDAGADVNYRSRTGYIDGNLTIGETPLSIAVKSKNVELVEFLLAAGANPNTLIHEGADRAGLTYLHLAVGSLEILEILLSKNINPNAKAVNGDRPLHDAAIGGHKEAIDLLLKRGARIDAKNRIGDTPLHAAASCNQKQSVIILLEKGAQIHAQCDSPKKEQTGPYDHGATPLHRAAENGNCEIIDLLIDKGADPNSEDLNGRTPLHAAISAGQDEAVKRLISKGADVSYVSRSEVSPLKYARRLRVNYEILKFMASSKRKCRRKPSQASWWKFWK